MSFHLPDKTEAIVNQDVSQSFFINQAMNNSFIHPIQDVTQSFIVPEKNHKEKEDDNKSQEEDLENILKKLDEQNKDSQNRNYNNNNRYDRSENKQEPRKDYDNVFDQYKKKEKPKVTENLMDEDWFWICFVLMYLRFIKY